MKIVVLFGGNLGDSVSLFSEAISKLDSKGFAFIGSSSIYRSESWGYNSTHIYLNQVVLFDSIDDPYTILEKCLSVETELGRIRKNGPEYSDRPIDIDLLYIDNKIINSEQLVVPHPRLHLRRFTLAPLTEIIPDFIHPVFLKDNKSLLLLCSDKSSVERIS